MDIADESAAVHIARLVRSLTSVPYRPRSPWGRRGSPALDAEDPTRALAFLPASGVLGLGLRPNGPDMLVPGDWGRGNLPSQERSQGGYTGAPGRTNESDEPRDAASVLEPSPRPPAAEATMGPLGVEGRPLSVEASGLVPSAADWPSWAIGMPNDVSGADMAENLYLGTP